MPEAAAALVQIEFVGLPPLQPHHAVGPPREFVVLGETLRDLEPAPHAPHRIGEGDLVPGEEVEHRAALVAGEVEVEVPVAVDIGQRARHPPARVEQPRVGRLRETPLAVVQEHGSRALDRGEDEIVVVVSVHVDERGAGRKAVPGGDAALDGRLPKPPVPEIDVEGVGTFQAREVEVRPAVPVHVPGGHSGAVPAHLVLDEARVRERVGEVHPGPRGRNRSEPGVAPLDRQGPPAGAGHLRPLARLRGAGEIGRTAGGETGQQRAGGATSRGRDAQAAHEARKTLRIRRGWHPRGRPGPGSATATSPPWSGPPSRRRQPPPAPRFGATGGPRRTPAHPRRRRTRWDPPRPRSR